MIVYRCTLYCAASSKANNMSFTPRQRQKYIFAEIVVGCQVRPEYHGSVVTYFLPINILPRGPNLYWCLPSIHQESTQYWSIVGSVSKTGGITMSQHCVNSLFAGLLTYNSTQSSMFTSYKTGPVFSYKL